MTHFKKIGLAIAHCPTEVSLFMSNNPICIYYISYDAHGTQKTLEMCSALNVCLLRCTHLSCMMSHMKIHIWKAEGLRVCVCVCVDNMSGPLCVHEVH